MISLLSERWRRLRQGPPPRMLAQWNKDQGDQVLRLDYPLNERSLVFDLGGHRGSWAEQIFARYGCRMHIFEPIKEFVDDLHAHFAGNANITIHPYGLASKNETVLASFEEGASSMFRWTKEKREIELKEASSLLADFDKIDLMKINIEGGEFDLLLHLLDKGLIGKMIDLQIQFHRDMPKAKRLRNVIRKRLTKTHKLTYDYPFVWENWRLIT